MFDDKNPQSNSPLPSQEPEDIFKNTEPAPKPATNEPVQTPASEPVLKTPPPFFMKKNGVNGESNGATPQIESLPPLPSEMSPKTFNQKNLILLILIIVAALAVAGGGVWWFFLRDKTSPIDNPPVNLFENTNTNTDETAPPVNTGKEDEPADPTLPEETIPTPDADGDGLTDAEEAALGTSINSADTDNDGLYDREEAKVYKTDPLKADTDNDGLADGEEVRQKLDPLTPNANTPNLNYRNTEAKIELNLLENMVLESSAENILQFNDNINQIKFYIYRDDQIPAALKPDWAYTIGEDNIDRVIIKNSQKNTDETPYSTEISTSSFPSSNGHTYLIYYIATMRAPDHQAKFETLLTSIKFLK